MVTPMNESWAKRIHYISPGCDALVSQHYRAPPTEAIDPMGALRKGQARAFSLQGGIIGEARIVERASGVGPCALTEAIALLQDHLASAES